MTRPRSKVIIQHTDSKTFRTEQVLEASGIWAVFYQGKPFNLMALNRHCPQTNPVYKKVSFTGSGNAHALANKLNKKFNCNDFSVVELFPGNQHDQN